MKAQLTGRINRIVRHDDHFDNITKNNDMTEIEVEFRGNVDGAVPTAKPALMRAFLKLKPLIADKLQFGSTIYLTISDEEPLIEEANNETSNSV